ncbi:hypothetical protein QGN29_14305 [Temperatibacter marinus]|uniref:Uncharacterized protein n=1 Tax=Temperatibacter marinus TaxID=1456591 RepID=A0AA52HAG6_9PROT|nr:hypothetical protein [Temperatibacter marinus]WND02720.1 hypothetical protein QGN29_14305 [Temperatibacter marinus]
MNNLLSKIVMFLVIVTLGYGSYFYYNNLRIDKLSEFKYNLSQDISNSLILTSKIKKQVKTYDRLDHSLNSKATIVLLSNLENSLLKLENKFKTGPDIYENYDTNISNSVNSYLHFKEIDKEISELTIEDTLSTAIDYSKDVANKTLESLNEKYSNNVMGFNQTIELIEELLTEASRNHIILNIDQASTQYGQAIKDIIEANNLLKAAQSNDPHNIASLYENKKKSPFYNLSQDITWMIAKKLNTFKAYKEFDDHYPEGIHTDKAMDIAIAMINSNSMHEYLGFPKDWKIKFVKHAKEGGLPNYKYEIGSTSKDGQYYKITDMLLAIGDVKTSIETGGVIRNEIERIKQKGPQEFYSGTKEKSWGTEWHDPYTLSLIKKDNNWYGKLKFQQKREYYLLAGKATEHVILAFSFDVKARGLTTEKFQHNYKYFLDTAKGLYDYLHRKNLSPKLIPAIAKYDKDMHKNRRG